jgi:hypothetical protein
MRIIFKFDDFTGVNEKVLNLDKIVKKYGIVVGWGIIGSSVANWSETDVKFIVDSLNSTYYFFWNHGWSHANREFCYYDSVEAEEMIRRTNEIVKKKIHYTMTTFGAPCNAIGSSTSQALNKIEDIKYWLFGDKESFNGVVLERHVDMEYPIFRPNFFRFVISILKFKTRRKMVVLQGHPCAWGKKDFFNFKLICMFIKIFGIECVTPEEGERGES